MFTWKEVDYNNFNRSICNFIVEFFFIFGCFKSILITTWIKYKNNKNKNINETARKLFYTVRWSAKVTHYLFISWFGLRWKLIKWLRCISNPTLTSFLSYPKKNFCTSFFKQFSCLKLKPNLILKTLLYFPTFLSPLKFSSANKTTEF